MAQSSKETPLMKQYNQIKAKYPDALLLFRVGDFYETFGNDAVRAAGILGIVLTKRGAGSASETELAGFPHHALETYLPKLVRAGERVAICDQLEDPKATKKLVKRGVTELITPGVTLTEGVLDEKSNNFVAALHVDKQMYGLAFLDISTGEFQLGVLAGSFSWELWLGLSIGSLNWFSGEVRLGISIANDIIRSHGGSITLGKSPLNGLRVKISLPL